MNTCQHKSIVGDNYGTSCRDCGAQLSGYGYGGWFGRNITQGTKCIHVFSPIADEGDKAEICIYCEQINNPQTQEAQL